MNRNRVTPCIIAAAVAALTASTPALAGVTVDVLEVGSDVVFEGGGTLDISLWDSFVESDTQPGVQPNFGLLLGAIDRMDLYEGPVNFAGPASIGPGINATPADERSRGEALGILWVNEMLAVPVGYTSGDPLSASAVFGGHTFETLGVAEGTFTWTWDTADGQGDFFTINVGVIPAPSSIALLGIAGMFGKRRRRNA